MDLQSILFPKKCLGCGRSGAYFCSDCLNFVSIIDKSICPVCEKPSIGGITHPTCRGNKTLDGFTSVFSYRGIIAKAIARLKYQFISDIGMEFTEIFVSLCGEDRGFVNYCRKREIVLVPVPLHPDREKWRGFSQTELLGKLITKDLGFHFCPNMVKRVKNTRPQVGLKEDERRENIKNAFVSENASGLDIVLFDDVWTSGSTLKEAGRVLKKAGAKTVWGLTLAR